MKFLKWFSIILGALIGLFLIVALFLPSEATLSAEQEIGISQGQVFHNVAKFKDRQKWDPWLTMDPDAAVTISPAAKYVGSSYEWNGEIIGKGKMEVRYANYPDRIESKIWFGESPLPSDVSWDIKESGNNTKVTWTFSSTGSYPFGRYMLLMMKGALLTSFETGLEQLKVYLEEHPPVLYELSPISIDKSYDTWTMVYPARVNVTDMGDLMMTAFPAIMQAIQSQGLELNGPSFVHYTDHDPETSMSNVFIAFPVSTEGKPEGVIKPKFYKTIEAVTATHTGQYDYFQESYAAMQSYITEKNIEVTGEAFEVYLTTMMDSQNPMEWKTMIAFPLK
ncbi:GyrI-like domain-containing protein [Bacteroidota bacterium]